MPNIRKHFPEPTSELTLFIDNSTRQKVLAAFGGDEELARIFCYAYLAHPRDHDSGYPGVSVDDINKIIGAYRGTHSITGTFERLEPFGVTVTTGQNIDGPAFIMDMEIPEDWEFVHELLNPTDSLSERVRIFDGARYGQDAIEIVEPEIEDDCPEITRELLGILNDASNRFINFDEITPELRKINFGLWKEGGSFDMYRCNGALIGKAEVLKREIYQKRTANARIYPSSLSCCTRDIRKAYQGHAGLIVFDLQASQLWLIAHMWKLPELRTYLERDGNVWENICEDCDLDVSIHKPQLKILVYGLVFGSQLHWAIQKFARVHPHADLERIQQHPVIQTISEAHKARLEEVRVLGEVIDRFGRSFPSKGNDAKSAIAQEIQSQEHWIMAHLAVKAHELEGVTLRMFLHDEIAVELEPEFQDELVQQITDIFNDICKEEEIVMKLDVS